MVALLVAMAGGGYQLWRLRQHAPPTPKPQFGAKRQLPALRPDTTPSDTETVGDVAIVYPSIHPRSVLEVPVDSMAIAVNDGLRLKPDIRFVAAVAHIHRILTGTPLAPVTLIPRPTGWDIQYRGEVAGTLPDLPSFHDGERMLAAWTAHIRGSAGPASTSSLDTTGLSADIDDFDAVHMARTLRVVDTLWQATHDPSLLPIAARGLVMLAVQTIDRTDVADAVPTQALAATILAPSQRDRALLASEMGYFGEAVAMSDSLGANDPVRLYLMDDRAPLERAGARPNATPLTRFLYLRRLAYDDVRANDHRMVARTVRHRYSWGEKQLPVFSVALQSGDFEWDRRIPALIPLVAAVDLSRITGRRFALDTTPYRWIQRLATQAKHVDARSGTIAPIPAGESLRAIADAESVLDTLFPGPLADGATIRDYFRAHLDGAVAAACDHELDEYSNAESTADLVAEYLDAPATAGGAVAQWCRHALDATRDPNRPNDFLADARNATLGKALRLQAFERVERANVATENEVSLGAAYLVSRLDSRPDMLWDIAYRLEWTPRAMAVAERLYRRYSELVPTPGRSFDVEFAIAEGDGSPIVALANDPHATVNQRLWAINTAVHDSLVKSDRARAVYARLVDAAPDQWSVREPYEELLERMHDYPAAATVVRDWIGEAHRDTLSDAFDWVNAHMALGRILDEQGEHDAAWKTVYPYIGFGSGRALDGAAIIAEHRGCAQCQSDANALTRRSVETYPDGPDEHAARLYILWHQSRYPEAAAHFGTLGSRWKDNEWKSAVDSMFLMAFVGRGTEEVSRAILAMDGVPGLDLWDIGELADAADKAGHPDWAFTIQSMLHRDNERRNQSVGPRFAAYEFLLHWKGADSARAWLVAAVPRPFDDAMAGDAYTFDKTDRLLWSLPLSDSSTIETWLFRAAASVRRRTPDPHRAELVAYFSDPSHALFAPQGDSAYYTFGRFLLGLTDRQAVFGAMTTPDHRCEGAYYIGLVAQHEGRYADALDWYRASINTHLKNNSEWYWAQYTLDAWIEHGKNLDYLEKHGL